MEQANLTKEHQEFLAKKKELSDLKDKLAALNKNKEEAFHSLRSLRDTIKSTLAKIKGLKSERDILTTEVKELKKSRNELNTSLKEKALTHKQKDTPKPEFFKGDHKESPASLKRQVESLEQKIETEVISFTKEKELRKQIKELKAKYAKLAKASELVKVANKSAKDLVSHRRLAQKSHVEVQQKAKQSQQKHEEMNEVYDKVKKLREEEKQLVQKYVDFKKEYDNLKNKQDELNKRIKELSKLFDEKDQGSYKIRVQEKTAVAKEKMKTGKKLTTEDILALQAEK